MKWAPEHPRATANGYVREHILVWEENHGRLPDGHVVHHLNGVRADNRPENLAGVPRTANRSWHLVRMMQERIRALEGGLNDAGSTQDQGAFRNKEAA